MAHSAEIKGLIDHAWGVGHGKHKKKEPADIPIPDPSDPHSRENLSYGPVGQDSSRKRYWVVDGPCTPLSPPPLIFACICPDPDVLCAFLSIPIMRRSPSPYLIIKFRCRVHPDLLRLAQSLLVNQSVEGDIDNSNGIVYERRIYCIDRQVENIGA